MNKQIFFGQYHRITSYFQGTDLASSGVPTGKELALLETVRDKVPAELFKHPYTNPVCGTPARMRHNLRHALRLLREAGYVVKNQQLIDKKTGEQFTIEFLANAPISSASICSTSPRSNASASPCRSAWSMRRNTRAG